MYFPSSYKLEVGTDSLTKTQFKWAFLDNTFKGTVKKKKEEEEEREKKFSWMGDKMSLN